MDELEISGKRYISTRLAAKEHKYHSDYIGQLIRAKKILGQKVGRSWYVEEKSLAAYFDKEAPIHLEEAVVVAKAPEPVAQKMVETPREMMPTMAAVAMQVETASSASASEELLAAAAKILEAAKNVATPAQEIVVEEKIAEEIPVHVEAVVEEENTQEPEPVSARDSIHIPIRVTRPSFVALKNKAGLRYIDDDAPALPEVIKKTNRRSKTPAPVATQVNNEEVYITEYAQRDGSGILVPAFSIAVLGIVAFAVVAVSSVLVNSNMLIEAGKTASAWYSFH